MRGADEDLASEFEYESDIEKKRRRKDSEDGGREKAPRTAPSRQLFHEEKSKEEGRIARLMCMDAYSRHKQIFNDYYLYYPGATKILQRDSSKDKTDIDVILEHQKFLWESSEEPDTWEKKLAKRYYDKLFKEYCISDLSRYKENKVAMRWRTEKEVVEGKGQFICGERKCPTKEGLSTWEVNFSYLETGSKRNALVKLRLCPECSYKLNYHHKRKQVMKKPKKERKRDKMSSERTEAQIDREKDPVMTKREPSSEHQNSGEESGVKSSSTPLSGDPNIWKNVAQIEEEKSREDEFEDFLDDLLL